MLNKLINRSRIQTKIIVPFLLIMAITSLIFLTISINFISKNVEKSLYNELDKQSLLVQKSMEDRFKKSIFYAQLISDMKKNLDSIQNEDLIASVKQIFTDLINQDHTIVYLSLNDIETWKKQIYFNLINEGYQGKTKVAIAVNEDADQHLRLTAAAVGSIKNNGLYYPIISEYSFDNRFLIDIKGQYKSDIALIFSGLFQSRLRTEILASTDLFFQNKVFKKQLNQILMAPENVNFKRLIKTLKIQNKSYSMIIERMDLNPQVYSVVVTCTDELDVIKRNIIQITILAFIVIILLMMLVYYVIIQRITASINILSEGVKNVADGDLTYQVEVKTQDEIGELSHFFNQMVSSVKESTQNVLDEKNRSEAIIANIPEGIIVTDSENRLILANEMAQEMFHFSLEEVFGQFILKCINNEDLLNAIKAQMENSEKQYSRELKMMKGTKEHYYILNSRVARNTNREQIGVITVLRDITHDKELNELREGFLRTVSHELRTPLTSIIGFIDLILQGSIGPTTSQQKEYLTISLNQALNLKQLITDILDLSRLEAGQVRLLFSEIQVQPFIEDITHFFIPLLKDTRKKLTVIKAEKDKTFTADNEKIRRVLINLIANAIKFTEEGDIVIRYIFKKDMIEFSVQDNGIGLKEEEKKFVFDKFRQATISSSRQFEGIGLGLSIAKELVELHHGKIWVESEYRQGATFKFTIPVKERG